MQSRLYAKSSIDICTIDPYIFTSLPFRDLRKRDACLVKWIFYPNIFRNLDIIKISVKPILVESQYFQYRHKIDNLACIWIYSTYNYLSNTILLSFKYYLLLDNCISCIIQMTHDPIPEHRELNSEYGNNARDEYFRINFFLLRFHSRWRDSYAIIDPCSGPVLAEDGPSWLRVKERHVQPDRWVFHF